MENNKPYGQGEKRYNASPKRGASCETMLPGSKCVRLEELMGGIALTVVSGEIFLKAST